MPATLRPRLMRPLRLTVVHGVLLLAGIAGCVYVPNQRHDPGGVVLIAPPPPPVETVGAAPTPGYVWLGGYWAWVGDRHVWIAGHWEAPRPGMHWVPPLWVRQGDGWRLRRGHWERG
ncbi:MAG: hypothetical protein NVSMB10_02210 [Steroidobacteraceae bacterium]